MANFMAELKAKHAAKVAELKAEIAKQSTVDLTKTIVKNSIPGKLESVGLVATCVGVGISISIPGVSLIDNITRAVLPAVGIINGYALARTAVKSRYEIAELSHRATGYFKKQAE